MTQREETATGRRRWTWSIEKAWNRAAYSFVVAVLINIAIHNEVLSLAFGLALFLVLTAIVAISRRR